MKATCVICGKEVNRPPSHLRRTREVFCGYRCNGVRRGQEWAKYGEMGPKARTPESYAKAAMRGPNNPAWKGGVTYFRKHGNYKPIKYVRCPMEFLSMARKDGYVMEHRLIKAMEIGRPLIRVEVVHHINHDPQDNRIENLELFPNNRAHKIAEGALSAEV